MNIANEITYISTDDHRQVIPWVRIKDRQGNVTEFYDRNRPLSPEKLLRQTNAAWIASIVIIVPRTFISRRISPWIRLS